MTPDESATPQHLDDETFMSAEDLRAYMSEMQMARKGDPNESMGRAEKARQDLIKQLAEPIKLTPQRLSEIVHSLQGKLRKAAEEGNSELLVMRFPNSLCTDKGRSINNSEAGWPDTLTGRPRQAYELWRDQLKPNGYRISAMIIDWPGGLPGDIGFFLRWGAEKQ